MEQHTQAAVEALFVKAISRQELAQTASSLLDDHAANLTETAKTLAQDALASVVQISENMEAAQDEVVAALARSSITATPVGDAISQRRLQFHRICVAIDRRDLAAALRVLDAEGFVPPLALSASRVAVLGHTLEQLQMVRFDGATTRLILQFNTPPSTMLPRVLRPGVVDVAGVDLPKQISFLYYGGKPLRILSEKLRRRRSPHHAGDFMGTPAGLIAPILQRLALTPEDVLIDVGCGDGRILLAAAERFGCRAFGIEHNQDLAERAKENAAKSDATELIEVVHGNAENADLGRGSVIFMFLPHRLRADVMSRVRHKLKPGTRIVTHEQIWSPGDETADVAIPVFNETGITVLRIWTVDA